MCDICKTATGELETFLKQLVEKYPGTTVVQDGVKHDVSRVHHVFVALNVAAQPYIVEEFDHILKKQAEAEEKETGLPSWAQNIKGKAA